MNEKIYRVVSGLFLVTWMGIIFWFSAQEATESSRLSGGFCDRIVISMNEKLEMEWSDAKMQNIAELMEFPIRKAAHMAEYAALGLLCFFFYKGYSAKIKRLYLWSLTTTFIYAISDEIHQYFVEGRAARFTDVCIDTLGAAIALLMVFAFFKIIGKHCEK